ncbi:unnamed protein product [Ceratitis capitata]|uniref:(Mediterranean fruit fly) hypothetical protein n=1 Tax=Ceratitis capitata TaxID=7213 RepID=A0A811U433_CERCA|nr:unnamed protein product [Ceratitis capitata]
MKFHEAFKFTLTYHNANQRPHNARAWQCLQPFGDLVGCLVGWRLPQSTAAANTHTYVYTHTYQSPLFKVVKGANGPRQSSTRCLQRNNYGGRRSSCATLSAATLPHRGSYQLLRHGPHRQHHQRRNGQQQRRNFDFDFWTTTITIIIIITITITVTIIVRRRDQHQPQPQSRSHMNPQQRRHYEYRISGWAFASPSPS